MIRTGATASLLATLLVMTGCTRAEPQTPSPSASASSSSSMSTTATPSDSPEAQAAQAVVAFWKLRDQLASDPSQGVTKLAEVARGQALDVHRRSLNAQAAQGWTQVGFVTVTPGTVKPTDKPGEYSVVACVNVSTVNIVDAEGKSHVPPGRPEQSAYTYKVQQDGAQWYVVEDLLEATPC